MRAKSDLNIELLVGLAGLTLSTAGFLVDAYALAVLGLIISAVGFGILLGRPPK
jgi:hypothetical protein